MKKKNIFLAYGYSQKNAGDIAICIGALDILIFDFKYNVTLLSRYHKRSLEYEESKEYFLKRYGDDIKILPSPFYLEREATIIRQFYNYIKSAFNYIFSSRNNYLIKSVKQCDYVIFNGGNLLRCSSMQDYIRLIALDFPLKFARKYNKRYIIFPHSSAEINKIGEKIIFNMLVNAEKVFLRENLSYSSLKSRFKLNNLSKSIDLAYFINKDNIIKQNFNFKTIAFTFRALTVGDLLEMDQNQKNMIHDKIALIINEFNSTCGLTFVIQSLKDKEFTLKLKNIFEKTYNIKIDVFESYDPLELIKFYNNIDVLIGMRLHSIILATSVGTPCYGLFFDEWGLKNPGTLETFELPYCIIDKGDSIDIDRINLLISKGVQFNESSKKLIDDELSKIKKEIVSI